MIVFVEAPILRAASITPGHMTKVERAELLPYHVLGVHKYKTLGMPYPLEGVEPMDPQKLSDWQTFINNHLN